MDLYEAYGLRVGDVVTAVGAGGRTRLLKALAADAARRGLSVLVTATTRSHPAPHERRRVITGTDTTILGALAAELRMGEAVVAIGELGADGRLAGFAPETVARMATLSPGLLVVDGDGAGGRPFKAPAEHEPVIPEASTDVIVCVGVGVLGRPLDGDTVHRPEIVAALAPCAPGAIVTADAVVEVLTHDRGGRKGVPPGARLSALLDSPPTREHERLGAHIAERLVYAGFYRAVVANTGATDGVLAVVR